VSAEQGAPLAPNHPTPGRGVIIDASEGTALDPLRDKSYDLMSPKTVPVEMSAAYAPRPNPYGPRPAGAAAKPAGSARSAARTKVPHAAAASAAQPAAAPAAQ
jgi:hypothetical protein